MHEPPFFSRILIIFFIEFDSRLALSEKKKTCKSMSFFFRGTSVPRSSIFSASLWSAQGRRPPDVVRRLALSQDGPEKSDSRVRFARFYERCKDAPNWLLGACSQADTFRTGCIARQPTNAKHLAVGHRVADASNASKRHANGTAQRLLPNSLLYIIRIFYIFLICYSHIVMIYYS